MELSPNKPQQVTCPRLPIAVYREVAAHLRQVQGVNASVILRSVEHDPTAKFDYYQSQASALQIDCDSDLTEQEQQQVNNILDYYAQVYTPWQMK